MSAKILIVEDDPALQVGLKDNFEMREFEVETASNGTIGLKKALNICPDLIILDVMIPEMNGYEVCSKIREAGHSMPIIMLTAKGEEDDIIRGLNHGADDYVTKPFSVRELVARCNAFLRRHHEKTEDISEFAFNDFRLDLTSHRFFNNENEIPLMPKEFKLLEFFLYNAGKALSREEIMQNVWGEEVHVTSRSVDRCVTTLRSKIEPNTSSPIYIKTVRDVGYRFEVPEL